MTEAGRRIGSRDETIELDRRRHKEYAGGQRQSVARTDAVDGPSADEPTEESWQAVLREIEPAAFERLCQRLLRERGFRGSR